MNHSFPLATHIFPIATRNICPNMSCSIRSVFLEQRYAAPASGYALRSVVYREPYTHLLLLLLLVREPVTPLLLLRSSVPLLPAPLLLLLEPGHFRLLRKQQAVAEGGGGGPLAQSAMYTIGKGEELGMGSRLLFAGSGAGPGFWNCELRGQVGPARRNMILRALASFYKPYTKEKPGPCLRIAAISLKLHGIIIEKLAENY